MKKLASVLIFMLMLPLLVIGAERVNLVPSSEDVAVTVIESNEQHTVLQFDVAGFSREAVTIDGQEYFKIQLGKESVLLNAGEPALPRLCRSIIIPDNAKMEIQVLSSDYRDFPQTPIIPSKGSLPRTINPADVPYEFGPVYRADQWYPEELASIREPYILRDWRGTVVELNVFRYHTGRQLLRVYTSVTVEIRSTGPGLVNVMNRLEPLTHVNPDFDLIYQRHFLNYGMDETRYTPVRETGEMLVITYDSFHSAMQPFVDWKNQKGIPTTIVDVSTIPNNSSAIDAYIDDFYTATSGNLCWVLLVGDAAQIATPTASSGASDPTYAKTFGGDNYPDIFVGRFSAESVGDVETQVERTIEYERDASSSSTWYDDGTGIASAEGPGHNEEYDYEHMDFIRTDLLNFTYSQVDQIYDPGATASQVTTAVNAGRSFINYCGHGSTTAWSTTGFSNTNVNALTNNNKLPFIHSVACVNGNFTSTTCFAEAWLRATNGSEPTGAVATYMSSINQDWDPPMTAQDESADLLCAESMLTFGGICYNGSCKMMDLHGTSGVNMYNTWHIFGDPSVQLRTAAATVMSVSHDGEINFGIESFSVTVSG
ncbi:agmatine deiminase, partial [bacterium]|nr:agmatine deiminase [bacterium]